MQEKEKKLRQILKGYGRVLVGFSGGTDSAYLLAVAAQELPGQVLAVTAVSPTSTALEIEEAQALAKGLAVEHRIVQSKEMQNRSFTDNPAEKCYHCKYSRFTDLQQIARQRQIPWVLDGSNVDDLEDFRPGSKAVQELKVRSPLQEAGLNKNEIRELSRLLRLPTWNKPSSPCLASRIPYGQEITEEKLRRIEEAELFLRELGFSPRRVRHVGTEARLEISPQQFGEMINRTEQVTAKLRQLGFTKVTLDLMGFRSGSLNEELINLDKRGY